MILAVLATMLLTSCVTAQPDGISAATSEVSWSPAEEGWGIGDEKGNEAVLIVLAASPSGSTTKVARVLGKVLEAKIVGPEAAATENLDRYTLVGFGSGIFRATNHPALLQAVGSLPPGSKGKAFLFSTCGIPTRFATEERLSAYVHDNHGALRKKLQEKGYQVVGEFGCPGFNDNRFLKLFGGLNRGHPDEVDLERAAAFARDLRQREVLGDETELPGAD